ncbi:hypothetical protein JG688_00001783 [Phytophthora aleatoria]|uniref:Uncharacterized protein n=1 Tax=Phytophthora aleatoria TaxID=2496075 RepID=A0A8J5JCT7_9STRA|nr:hypothetical protein JG688_00001783 [Phytophthora aleatoria]
MVWALFVRRVTYADLNALNITWRFFEQYSRKTRGETRWLSSLKVLQWLEDVWDFPRKSSLFAATKLSKLQCAASSSLRPVKPSRTEQAQSRAWWHGNLKISAKLSDPYARAQRAHHRGGSECKAASRNWTQAVGF